MIYGDITPVSGQTKVVALKMQEKVVSPSTSTQKVMADEDYDGLISVVVEGMELQEKTVTPSTSEQEITFDYLYDGLSKVTVNAMPTTTQATPSISVSSAGLITASATQTAGYVAAGTKSGTKQLTVQAAKTVTPTTSNQTAVASGVYTTGAITVKGDANLKAANIKKGVSIFGVTGTDVGAPVLLWTNASPGSEFAAQTVTLGGSAYTGYLIETANYTNTDGTATGSNIQYRGFNDLSPLTGTYEDSTNLTGSIYTREISALNSSGITFQSESYRRAIPLHIWGIKWTL